VLSMTVCHLRREPVVQQRYHSNRKGDSATAMLDTPFDFIAAVFVLSRYVESLPISVESRYA
jgi:hypothetical protein